MAAAASMVATNAAFAQAQAPPATKPAIPARPPSAAALKEVLGTVNGESITRGDLLDLLSRYPIPAGNEEQVYRDGMDTLVNNRLVSQYLTRQRIPVSEDKVNDAIATVEKQLKQDGNDLATEMRRTGMSMDDIKREFSNRVRWVEFVNNKATDAELKRFVVNHKDLFNGTQVRASHILLKVDPKASASDKEKVHQKLVALKNDIESNKLSFAEAANKHSEDPANADGAGGDLGYFALNSGFIEEFANPAFAMKKGAISDPVETPYGYHLIMVTDRKEGTPFDFEANKPLVKQLYAADLQKSVLSAERKTAKIDIKPMPADLFPPAPTPTSAPAAAKPGTAK
jgi:parvulin-like peptidyl-prolyl isomerase